MRLAAIVTCDGCGNKISDPSKAWEWDDVVPDMVVVVHPNARCVRSAEYSLGVILR